MQVASETPKRMPGLLSITWILCGSKGARPDRHCEATGPKAKLMSPGASER